MCTCISLPFDAAGRPDAPNITFDENNPAVLRWNHPNDRGQIITSYEVILMYVMKYKPAWCLILLRMSVICRQKDAPLAEERTITLPGSTISINLQEQDELDFDVAFVVEVVARNQLGTSDRSNPVTFTRLQMEEGEFLLVITTIIKLQFVAHTQTRTHTS